MRKIPVTLPSSHAVHVLALLPSSLQPWGGGPWLGARATAELSDPSTGLSGESGGGEEEAPLPLPVWGL